MFPKSTIEAIIKDARKEHSVEITEKMIDAINQLLSKEAYHIKRVVVAFTRSLQSILSKKQQKHSRVCNLH